MNRYCDRRDLDGWAVFDRQDKRFVYRYKTRDDARKRMRELNHEDWALSYNQKVLEANRRELKRMEELTGTDGNVGKAPETPG